MPHAFKFDRGLSEDIINFLKHEERDLSFAGKCDPKYLLLCKKIKESQLGGTPVKPKTYDFSGFCDYIADTNDAQESKNLPKIQNKLLPGESTSFSYQLATCIKCNGGNVREIIDLVSTLQSCDLESHLTNAWRQLSNGKDRLKFMELLSVHPSCSSIICKKILLSELKKEDNFHSTMEIIKPNIQTFQSLIISDLFIPLLSEGGFSFSDDLAWLEGILPLFSPQQKSSLLSCFIQVMEDAVEKSHLQILSLLLEKIPLNDNLIEKLVHVLNNNLSNFIQDRCLGKVLLLILDVCSPGTAPSVVEELTQICHSFKGVMRFRINAALKKLSQ